MECELLRVQIMLTDSGPPRIRLYENQNRCLGNTGGKRLFKRNILSFSLIHCSWRIRTLLLNSSFYGYQRLYRQPLPEAPRSAHPQPATPHPSLLLLLFYCCIHNMRPANFL
ncbi:hypothetical protein GOODEAATRI_028893 [Goodea atripinnis]|uniref:Ycf15 n=1 Tax=Goodea atripinnis TaxID=208336 RepID=A0ABV0P8N5_9TELE